MRVPSSAMVKMRSPFFATASGIAATTTSVFRHRERKWEIDGREIGLFQALMPAVLANVLGLPSIAVPMAVSREGLPIGVQLLGRPYEDELLLDIAARLHDARQLLPL